MVKEKGYFWADSKATSPTADHVVVFMSVYSAKPHNNVGALAWLFTRTILQAGF